MHVSVILPTYNEGTNIVSLVKSIASVVPANCEYEIIVVDDDSPDGTYETVRRAFRDDPRLVPLLRTQDRGLAKSIRAGIESARGDYVVVMDTDFTHNPEEIPKLLHVAELYDIVSGSRFCPGGLMQSTTHYLCSLTFNWLVRIILRTQIQDNTGGYFAIHRTKLLALPLERIFFGYGDYFFRLLHYAQKSNYSIVEIPARYIARTEGQSKSSFIRMFFGYTMAMFRMKWQILRD